MKINVVGCGGISRCHLSCIKALKEKGALLTAVCDIVPQRANKMAEEHGCNAYCDYIEMLNKEKPDVLHICTPHYLHVEMAVEALKRNINVVLEKPCATSFEGLKKLIQAEEISKAKLAVCFQNRYNSSTVFLKKVISNEEYGKVKTARAILTWKRDADYYAPDPWRGTWEQECGGVLINQAIHTHDLLQYLMNKETASVDGQISNFHLKNVIEVEDTASVYFTYTDGTRAVYFATNALGESLNPFIDFVCEKAILRLEGDNVYKIANNKCELLFSYDGTADTVGKKEWGNSHARLIDDFYDCIENGKEFWLNSKESARAVFELLSVYEASKEKQ